MLLDVLYVAPSQHLLSCKKYSMKQHTVLHIYTIYIPYIYDTSIDS